METRDPGVAGTIARNTVFNFIATASDLASAFVSGIVLARSLGTEQYGLYSLFMWFLPLAGLATNLGLAEMAKRFIAEALGTGKNLEARKLVRMAITYRAVAAAVATLVILVSSKYLAGLFGASENQVYFVLIAFGVLPYSFNYALPSIFAGFQNYKYAALVVLGTGPLRVVLVIIFLMLGAGVWELLILNIAVLVLGAIIGFVLLGRLMPIGELLSRTPIEAVIRNRSLKYALTMAALLGVDYLAYKEVQIFFIGLYAPVQEVGFYTLASRLASVSVTLIPTALAFVLLPAVAEQYGKGNNKTIQMIYLTSARYLMMAALPLAAGGIALAGPLITLLYGAEYAPAAVLMQILVVPFALGSMGQAAAAVVLGINRAGFILKINIFLALVNIGLSLWLIPRYGVMGAAVASSAPRVLILFPSVWFVAKQIGVVWPVRSTIKISVASLIMGLAVYALQRHVGAMLSLALGVPLGIAVYGLAILTLGVIGEQDLSVLRRIQQSFPVKMRRGSAPLLKVTEKIIAGVRLAGK